MDINEDKIDEAVLALLYLTAHGDPFGTRAWKGHDWSAMERLHEKGFISDPKGKAKSVAFSQEGLEKSEQLFKKLFSKT